MVLYEHLGISSFTQSDGIFEVIFNNREAGAGLGTEAVFLKDS